MDDLGRDENEVRKDFTPTEPVAIGQLIEEQGRPRASNCHFFQSSSAPHLKANRHRDAIAGHSPEALEGGGQEFVVHMGHKAGSALERSTSAARHSDVGDNEDRQQRDDHAHQGADEDEIL